MATINTSGPSTHTHGGAKASHINYEQDLKRSVLTCMLWEDSFYEDGSSIAERIQSLVPHVKKETVAEIAIAAREEQKLRHVPLLIVREMARLRWKNTASTLERVIQRPDEITEFLSIYWKDGKTPISKQVKKGLAKAYNKFNEYSFAKFNSSGKQIKLRDPMFLVHPRPNKDKGDLFRKIANETLTTPDTWEVALSGGADKKITFERLLSENKLGAMALLRNLRNMVQSGVDRNLIKNGLQSMNAERVLPFRFISAAKYVPDLEPSIEEAMFRCTAQIPRLSGKTILVVDTSGSMHSGNVSRKSELTRVDAATALAILIREMCIEPVIYATAGSDSSQRHATMQVPPRRGFALSDCLWGPKTRDTIGGGGIFLKQCLDFIYDKEKSADRVIVLTDEQDCDRKANPDGANAFGRNNYIINVSIEKNGVAYSKFHHINGWSEAILDYIREYEKESNF